jgi:hypothetical protein
MEAAGTDSKTKCVLYAEFEGLGDNVMNMDKESLEVAWCDIWAISCYCLWNWKNKRIA